MYNEAIVTSPVALFLGAGASACLDLKPMRAFIKDLRERKNYKSDWLFEAIIDREPDLEFLFEELEAFSELRHLAAYGKNRRSLGIAALDDPWNFVTEIASTADDLRSMLRREVYDAYSTAPDPLTVSKAYEPLLATVFEGLQPTERLLPIFTTNYDSAIEQFFIHAHSKNYELHDGFVYDPIARRHVWCRDSFQQQYDPSKQNLVLFKLHGSTSWFRNGDECERSNISVHIASDSNHENMLIYPAKRKVADDDPYFTAYDYFQRTLERQGSVRHGKLCIVIGYSFNDYDALSKLRSAAVNNPMLKLLVIDPRAEQLCVKLRKLGVNAQSIVAHFGDQIANGLPRLLSPDYLEEIKSALAKLDSLEFSDPIDSGRMKGLAS